MDSMFDDDYGFGAFFDDSSSGSSFSPNYTGDIMKGIGTGVSMFGEYQAGQEAKSAYDFNSVLDTYSAEATKVAGQEEQYSLGLEEESMLSTQRSIRAKSNVENSGSALDAAFTTAKNMELTKSIAAYNNQMKVLQYESKASQDKFYGQQAVNKSNTQMASTLMSGVGSIIGLAALL